MSGWTGRGDPPACTVSTELGTVAVEADGEVTFGRGSDATLRIGATPLYDDVVPRRAGRIYAHEGRVLVENTDDSLAFDLRIDGRPLIPLPPGHIHSPFDATFDIVVRGAITSYELAVRVNTDRVMPRRFGPDATDDELDPPTGAVPSLTERQRAILDAYVAPLRDGGMVASHQQVADALGLSRSLVRVECERIWSALFLAGVPMRDLRDARDEIVDAWSRHRM